MKIYWRHNAIIIESEALVKLIGFFATGTYGYARAKATAIYPFIFLRNEAYATPLIINHEKIHHRQQIETLYLGLFVLKVVETFYARVVLRLKAPDYYFFLASEQEAYRHQHHLEYLTNRPWFSVFKYIRDKLKLSFVPGNAPEVTVGEKW